MSHTGFNTAGNVGNDAIDQLITTVSFEGNLEIILLHDAHHTDEKFIVVF